MQWLRGKAIIITLKKYFIFSTNIEFKKKKGQRKLWIWFKNKCVQYWHRCTQSVIKFMWMTTKSFSENTFFFICWSLCVLHIWCVVLIIRLCFHSILNAWPMKNINVQTNDNSNYNNISSSSSGSTTNVNLKRRKKEGAK